ncbi:MAG: hypothetical protein V1740_00350 [Candidatus Woesearchaeota archaeon]
MATSKPIDLQTMTINGVKAMSPKDIADTFGVDFVGVYTNPTLLEWRAGTTYHIFGTSSALGEQSHQEYMQKGNFIIWGTTRGDHWHILLPCIDGKFIPPGSLTVEQYKPFLSRQGHAGVERIVAEYNTQSRLTDMLKQIIPVTLVGQNIDFNVLSAPADPAYPKGKEVRFLDDYIRELNRVYSLLDILGKKTNRIANGKDVLHYVIGSPLKNVEGEDILRYMLMQSAQAGQWQPFIIDVPHLTDTKKRTASEYLKSVKQIDTSNTGTMVEANLSFGVAKAMRGNLGLPIEYDNKLVVVPSQTFVEYIAQRR